MNYMGDYAVGQIVYIWFNTFDSNDPSASVTMTDFVTGDVNVHKDDSLTQRDSTTGQTIDIDIDGVAGVHWIRIDTSDNTTANFYEAGHDYFVRIEGVTIDGGTVNAVVGCFSIANRRTAGQMAVTSIEGLTDQNTFTLTTGEASGDDDAYNDCLVIVTDQTTKIQKAIGYISDYTGSTRSVQLYASPLCTGFTMAVGDSVEIFSSSAFTNVHTVNRTAQTAGDIAALVTTADTAIDAVQTDLDNGTDGLGAIKAETALIVADTGELQTDWVDGGRLDLLLDAVPTTAMRGTDSAALASVCTEGRLAELDAANLPTTTDDILTDTAVIGALGAGLTDITDRLPTALTKGTSDSGTNATMVDAARTEGDTDYWRGGLIRFTSGTITGQVRVITDFTPASDTITFSPVTTQAVGTNTYEILPAADVNRAILVDTTTTNTDMVGTDSAALASVCTEGRLAELDAANLPSDVDDILADTNELQTDWADGGRLDVILDSASAPTAAAVADAVWDEDATAHQTGGSFGQAIGDPGANTETMYDAVVTDAAGTNVAVDVVAVKAETALIVADTNELQTDDIPGTIAALNNITAGSVWAVDATTQQTQGTFGQAIGDPVADTTTIYQSVATDAAGDNVSIDVIAVKAETALIVADTNELQTDDYPTSIAAIQTVVDTLATTADLLDKLGAVNEAAAVGDPSATESVMQYIKQIINVLTGATGIVAMPAAAAPGNNVSIAEMIRAIYDDSNELQGDWVDAGRLDTILDAIPTTAMRGTDSAALASVATEARLAELDAANLPADVDNILTDTGTTIPGTITTLQADTDDIQTRLPAALVSGLMSSDVTAISTSASAADNLEESALGIVTGAAVGTPTTTVIDTDLTEVTTDHYNGRILTFITGAVTGQSTDITGYNGSTRELTVTALTNAPSATDTFVIT